MDGSSSFLFVSERPSDEGEKATSCMILFSQDTLLAMSYVLVAEWSYMPVKFEEPYSYGKNARSLS